ncbi:hypothetical protein GOBAR_AA38865 [Gossypium barbadense]|uniref:Complex III subunit VI n=1 Tax=Gossypium barbadense TaxID=3634 RepID=A0A2P5VSP2_GOSBA|nr:hypothetical protein GOBAR_AA38865 [Gossypium barbadense]
MLRKAHKIGSKNTVVRTLSSLLYPAFSANKDSPIAIAEISSSCLKACVKRIQGDESGHKHCTGQYFDYWSCVDKCGLSPFSNGTSYAHFRLESTASVAPSALLSSRKLSFQPKFHLF